MITKPLQPLPCQKASRHWGVNADGKEIVLHIWLVGNKFLQNPADHGVYAKETNEGKVIIVIRVDDWERLERCEENA